ncbi:uncharacterized protein LOC129940393 isoform X1 [Eupeodes corollae]|uniref:uncharacterized protein LOC129940393 isoform X1 n=1 Tax=Eupeodes corollae TaxID=290404 RepID=UPI00249135A0|nr:uncharacterized protein LOC129940393 isoform X1 [Eupeodes corollae]
MSAARSKYAWIVICLASIFISSINEATPLPSKSTSPLKISIPLDESLGFSNTNDDLSSRPIRKAIVSRSADDTDNTLDENDDKENPQIETPHQPSVTHQHGSHGPLGPVKHLLNTVRERFHGNGRGPLGGIGAIASILGDRHEATTHESPIETEQDRQNSNSSTGLHVLEFLGTLFTQVWGFLSNIPALFAASSANISGRQQN